MAKPLISVIIPTYKRPNLIGRAIRSVLNQTYQNFEIIVVDDSPNDNTKEAVKGFGDKRIKYIQIEDIEEGVPVCRKRNTGIKNISQDSKYIAFLDDDDEYLPNFLEDAIKEFEKSNDTGAVASYAEFKTKDGKRLKICQPAGEFWQMPVGNLWVLRREIFEKENIWFDEKAIFDDLDFGIRIPKDYKRVIIPKVSCVYYAFPLKKGESFSTRYEKLVADSDDFFKKHYATYSQAGKKALGFLHFFVGKIYCQAGKFKEGRFHLKEALKADPKFKYLLYYLISLLFPKIFKSYRILILKHRIFRNL